MAERSCFDYFMHFALLRKSVKIVNITKITYNVANKIVSLFIMKNRVSLNANISPKSVPIPLSSDDDRGIGTDPFCIISMS